VTENRTGLSYTIPIARNSIRDIKSPRNTESPVDQNDAGIRIFDPGFQNTSSSALGENVFRYVHDLLPNG
jgi:hypothetical protein